MGSLMMGRLRDQKRRRAGCLIWNGGRLRARYCVCVVREGRG